MSTFTHEFGKCHKIPAFTVRWAVFVVLWVWFLYPFLVHHLSYSLFHVEMPSGIFRSHL